MNVSSDGSVSIRRDENGQPAGNVLTVITKAALNAMKPSERATAVAAMAKGVMFKGRLDSVTSKNTAYPTNPYGPELHFNALWSNPDCAKAIQNLLKTAAECNPAHQLRSDDMSKLFENIASEAGFFSAPTATYNTVGKKPGDDKVGVYVVDNPAFHSYGPVNKRAKAGYAKFKYHSIAQTVLHELLHHAGFGDRALARAVQTIRGVELIEYSPDFNGSLAASKYWDKYLVENCK